VRLWDYIPHDLMFSCVSCSSPTLSLNSEVRVSSRELRDLHKAAVLYPSTGSFSFSALFKLCMSLLIAALRTRKSTFKLCLTNPSSSIHIGSHRIMLDLPRTPSTLSRVLVMGSGNFGSCLADHLADSEHRVSIWCRSAEVAESFNRYHKNPKYLKDHIFPETIEAIGPDLPDSKFMDRMDVVLFAVPTQGLRCKHHAHHANGLGHSERFCPGRCSRTSMAG
jgi:hypothetical protein